MQPPLHNSSFENGSHNRPTGSIASALDASIRRFTPPICQYCDRRHPRECRRLIGVCYRCGATDHFQRDYSKTGNMAPPQTQVSTLSNSRGKRQTRSELIGQSQRTIFETVDKLEAPRALTRAYAMKAREYQNVLDVIASTLLYLA